MTEMNEQPSNAIESSTLLCGNPLEECNFRHDKMCYMIGECRHQITEAEVYESKKQHEEAARPQ